MRGQYPLLKGPLLPLLDLRKLPTLVHYIKELSSIYVEDNTSSPIHVSLMPVAVFSQTRPTICHSVRAALAHLSYAPPTLQRAAHPHTPFQISWLLLHIALLHNPNPVSLYRLQHQIEVGRFAVLTQHG